MKNITKRLTLQKKKLDIIKNIFLALTLATVSIFISCHPEPEAQLPTTGKWHANLELKKGVSLPFLFHLNQIDSTWTMTIVNGEEEILLEDLIFSSDSLKVTFPVFESALNFKIIDENTLKGEWVNYYKSNDYKLSITAKLGAKNRFDLVGPVRSVAGKYEVVFSPDTDEEYPAIGLFKQNGSNVTGTFATETGDYRHLEGVVTNDSLKLSTFDGSHAFLFKAAVSDSILAGTFWSGSHFKENWTAKINPQAKLRNADSLTYLNPGFEKMSFTFPDATGKMVSLEDKQFKNKPVIVQIMGSWCPNCLDETRYLSSLYKKYNSSGLEIIALAFERTTNKEKALKNLKNLKVKTGADYTILLGGATRDDKAEEKLQMLNHVMSYPTAIFIDKSGEIRRIHTGFYGPSTGNYYEDFTAKTEKLVEVMLNEKLD